MLVSHERGALDLEPWLRRRQDEPFFLSVVTVSELLHGVHRAAESRRRARRSIFVEAVIDRFPILPLDLPTARVHAEIGAALASAGTPIGIHDLWIGAAALAHGLTVATANLREFGRIPGLGSEDWSTTR